MNKIAYQDFVKPRRILVNLCFQKLTTMPLPNCGYFNKEEKKSQELIFESPPEIVEESDSDEGIGGSRSSSGKRVRAKVTTGIL